MSSLTASSAADWVDYSPRSVLGLTLMRAHFDVHQFERHSHDSFAIGLTTSGVQSFRCDGSRHASLPGDLILFNPDQAHDGHKGVPEGFGYTMLYLPVDAVDGSRDAEAGLRLARHFRQPVARDAALARAFRATVAAIEQAGETLRAQTLLTTLVQALMLRQGERAAVSLDVRQAGAQRMTLARDYLAANFRRDVGVAELAAHTGLSRAHLTRAFTRYFGVPPHVWLNSVRLANARQLLIEGGTLADVALACGFADQSHFSRRFKGAMGLPPAHWLRQMRRG